MLYDVSVAYIVEMYCSVHETALHLVELIWFFPETVLHM